MCNVYSNLHISASHVYVSDHLPLRCQISCPKPNGRLGDALPPSGQYVQWDDPEVQEHFVDSLRSQLAFVPLPDLDQVLSREDATSSVNSIYSSICKAVSSANQSVLSISGNMNAHPTRQNWWSYDCKTARDRVRLYFHIWKSVGRPSSGAAHDCYKLARKQYRKICRQSVKKQLNKTRSLLQRLFVTKRQRDFWNLIRRSKREKVNYDGISIETLQSHFQQKFRSSIVDNSYTRLASGFVEQKVHSLQHGPTPDVTVSEFAVRRLIGKLKRGCAAGVDGITTEHVQLSAKTDVPLRISLLLTLCLRFGCVPDGFQTGLLVPILKKPQLDASLPSNYRPITVSVTMSKLLELFILEECSDVSFSPSQFGFVAHKGTNTAIALAHDVFSYCSNRGSTVYCCSLDAEGAFDNIPHSVLFYKAAEVLKDHSWLVLYHWYSRMSVMVKWAGRLSVPFRVEKGTRQGGLTSPFLFNVFYKELIDSLNSSLGDGIIIGGHSYNAFCYADDVLIASTTPTGLQRLIDKASHMISSYGLRFNPSKTTCMLFGHNPFSQLPVWTLGGEELHCVNSMKYLGAGLAKDSGSSHVNDRIKSAYRSFYALQNAGLYFGGSSPAVATHVFSMGVQTVLLYGCEAISLNKKCLKQLSTTQGNLVKAMLGLKRCSRTSPLLQSLKIKSAYNVIHVQGANLLRSCLTYHSKATDFYVYSCFEFQQ